MKFGHLQRDCHKLLDECFGDKREAYKWLWDNYKLRHFKDLKEKDINLLRSIYEKLYKKSILEYNI